MIITPRRWCFRLVIKRVFNLELLKRNISVIGYDELIADFVVAILDNNHIIR